MSAQEPRGRDGDIIHRRAWLLSYTVAPQCRMCWRGQPEDGHAVATRLAGTRQDLVRHVVDAEIAKLKPGTFTDANINGCKVS